MADDLDYLLNWNPGQPLEAPVNTGSALGGQYENFSYKDRLKDPLYVADLREYFSERGISDKTDEELDTLLHDDSNYRDLNTIAPFFGARGSQADLAKNSKTDESLRRASRLHQVMQNAPTIFSEEGRSISEAGPSIAGAIVTDPVNWALGAVEVATGGVASPLVTGARAALTGGRSALMSGVGRGAIQAGKIGAAEGAITGVISDVGQQGIEQQLGLTDETSIARALEAGAIGSVVSAGAGGLFGAVGGGISGARGGRAVEGLRAKGYEDAEIDAILNSGAEGLRRLQQTEPDVYRQMIEDEKQAQQEALNGSPVDPVEKANELAEQQREIRIASHLGPLNDHLRELRERLADLRADNDVGPDGVGMLDDQISETLDQIANLEEARHFPASVEKRQKIVQELLTDADPAKRMKGREMMKALTEDRARFEAVMSSNVPEDISNFITERVSNRDALEAGRRYDTEDNALDEAARRAAFKARQRLVANDASKMAQAEGIVATESGELPARTDAATKDQARLTGEQVSSADADGIIEEEMQREAAAMAAEEEAKAAAAAAAAPPAQAATPAQPATPDEPAAQQAAPASPPAEEAISLGNPSAVQTEAAAPKQAAKTPVTKSTKNTKVKASKAAKQRAISVGVDLDEVKGTGQDGRILDTDIQAHVEQNGASDTFISSLDALAEVVDSIAKRLREHNVPDEQITQYVRDPNVFRAALVSYNRDVLGDVYDDDAIGSLMDMYESMLPRGEDGQFFAPSFRNKGEESAYHRAVAEYVTKGRTEKEAHLAASIDLARQRRGEIDKSKVDPRMIGAANPSSTLGRMDNASPIPVDEAGNPLIRLQSLLRTGRAFTDADGSEYSITDKAPNAASFYFDKAREHAARGYERTEKLAQIELRLGRKLTEEEILSERSLSKRELDMIQGSGWDDIRKEAKAQGRGFSSSPVQPFISKGYERVRDAKGRPNKGDILYVSGRSGKIFSDWRKAYADVGVPIKGDQQPRHLVDALSGLRSSLGRSRPSTGRGAPARARAAATDEAISLGGTMPARAGDMSFDDFLTSLAEMSGSKPITSTAPISRPDLPPLEKNGKRAYFINKKTGKVRVPTDKQISSGQTALNILGKSSPDDWTVEYHEKGFSGTKSGLDKARGDYQRKFDERTTATVTPPKAEALATESFTASLVPKLSAARSKLNDSIQRVASAPGVDTFFALLSLPDTFTGKELMAISDAAHKLPLSGINKNSLAMMKAIADIEDIVAPTGIRKAEPLRDQAIEQARSIFSKLPTDILNPITDILTSIADGMAPRLAVTNKLPDMSFDAQSGTILIPEAVREARAKAPVPQSFVFFHEIGHWAHLNLLSSRDRAEFWQWAIDNLPDQDAVRGQLGITRGSEIGGDQGRLADYLTAYYSSPAEFFAESFARWATGRLETAANPKMWQRFARYVKGIFDAIIGGKPSTDRDLEKLFLKILPDQKAEEIAENLDAIANGAQPIETAIAISPVRGLREPTAPGVPDTVADGVSLANRPDYMTLPLDELLEMGDEARAPFIEKLKQVNDQLDDVANTWKLAADTLDPDTAFEAYSKTQRFLVGTATTLEEKRAYLAGVARATGSPMQEVYSRSDEAFSPFQRYFSIVPRAKKMRRLLSLARTGRVQAMDENDLVELGSMPNAISEAEAIEAGLQAGSDPTKASRALLSVFVGEDGKEKAGLARLIDDMRGALNSAYEQTGLIPQTSLLTAETTPKELLGHKVGRFESVTVGDVFKKSGVKGKNWTVESISDDSVIRLRENNGDIVTVRGAEIDQYSRQKGGVLGGQVEQMREKRLEQARQLRDKLKRQRIDEARKIAYGKLEAMGVLPANPNAAAAKAVPEEALVKRITSNTELAASAADELISRDLAKPTLPSFLTSIVASPMDEARVGIKDIRGKLLDGDPTVDNDVAAFVNAHSDRIQLSPRNRSVNLAIKREVEENRGAGFATDTGVPASSQPQMTALLSNIEHRSRRVKHTARTLLYRAVRMGHPEANDVPDAEAFTPETDAWKAMRGRVKSIAETIAADGEADMDRIIDRVTSLIVDTNPTIKNQLDELSYTTGDAVDLMYSMLGALDRPIENGERKLASDLFDSAGYLLNGLIHNQGLRDAAYRLTYFNDLFANRRTATPDANAISNMTVTQAQRFSAGNLSPSALGLDPEVLSRAGYNDLVLLRSDGQIVTSPYDGFSSFKELAMKSIKGTPKSKGQKGLVGLDQTFYGEQINKQKTVLAIASKADGLRNAVNTGVMEPAKVERMNAIIDDHLALLEENGVAVPRYTVVAVKARNPFDTATVIDNPKMVQGLRDSITDAVEDGDIPDSVASKIDLVLSTFKLGQNGDRLYRQLSEVLTGDFTADDFIQAMGYDSIKNKFGQIRKVFDQDRMAPAEEFMGSHFYAPRMDFEDTLESPLGANVNMAMMSPVGAVNSFAAPAAYRMAKRVDDHGLKHWLLNFGRNRVPRAADAITPIRMKYKFLGANSARMRSGGMVTLGDWFENHFPWVQQEFSRRLIGTKSQPGPLRAIRSLPDMPSRVRRHLANSSGQTLKVESHRRILNALWEPSNPRHEAKLSADETAALKVIRDSMTKIWMDLKDAGVMMGSRGKNYFPQVWSQVKVRKDPNAAIDGFAKYFEIEARRNGQPVDQDAVRRKATEVVARLAEVDDQSLWNPDAHSMVAGAADQLDYGRKIALDRYPEALPFLRDFLEDDLESYLVKYFDQAAHRLSLAKKFGHRNHAFGDYLTTAINGREGIAKLLSARRTQEHSSFAFTPEDGLVDVSFTETYPMPFEKDPYRAVSAADEVIEIHRKLGPEQARRYLLKLAVPDQSRGGKPSVVYERRVDAIVDALRDFNGETKNITTSDAKFLTNSMKVAARRPLIGDTTFMVKTAKNLRAFNSLTLLSYTTIASLGDAFLPVVRSGSMRDTMRAWGKYMSDPDYRDGMRNIGAHIESLLHNRMTHMTGTPANRLTSAFFNATGLTPWTDEARAIATAVGLEAFKTAQKKALREYNPAVPLPQQSPTFRANWRLLKRYGLESFATRKSALDLDENLASDQVRVGLMKFVDDSVFSPNGDDVPIWAQTPWGAVLFQLKTFPTMMGRMAKEVLYDDMRLAINDRLGRPMDLSDLKGTGNLKRAGYLLTLMPLVGYGVNSVMDIIRGRGGEENDERSPASRTMSQYVKQLPGFDKDYQQQFGELEHIVDRETLDGFVGQYLSGLTTAAGFGLIASMLSDAASQAENGAFGTERMMSTVFGPSVGTGISAWHVAQGILDGNDRSTYPERTALRETLRRVPVLGGQNSIVNDLVDASIPESKRRKAKQQAKLYSAD